MFWSGKNSPETYLPLSVDCTPAVLSALWETKDTWNALGIFLKLTHLIGWPHDFLGASNHYVSYSLPKRRQFANSSVVSPFRMLVTIKLRKKKKRKMIPCIHIVCTCVHTYMHTFMCIYVLVDMSPCVSICVHVSIYNKFMNLTKNPYTLVNFSFW